MMASHRWIAGGGTLRLLAVVALGFIASPVAARPADWSGHIAEASARFGVPQGWIRRVIRAESGGRTMLDGRPTTSRAGAMGLMQLMPGTWREMRAAHGLGADPHDPRDNILAGTAYLRAMHDRFGYPGLFAAYKCRAGALCRISGDRPPPPGGDGRLCRGAPINAARPFLGVRPEIAEQRRLRLARQPPAVPNRSCSAVRGARCAFRSAEHGGIRVMLGRLRCSAPVT